MALVSGHTFVDGETVTAAKLNNLVNDATIGSTTVTTAMITDGSVIASKLATDSVTGAAISSNTINYNSLVNATGSTKGNLIQSGASGVFEELTPHSTVGLPLKSAGANALLAYAALDNVGVGATMISGHTEDTTPAKDDIVLTKDTDAGANKKVQLSNIFKVIGGMTALTASTVADADELVVLDATDSTPKKVTLSGLIGGSQAPTGPLVVWEEQTANTKSNSGTIGGSGSENTRVLNQSSDPASLMAASLGSNKVTLAAGNYYIDAVVPTYGTNSTTAWLYDVTGTAILIEGGAVRSENSNACSAAIHIKGYFTLGVQSEVSVIHYIQTTTTNGLGYPVNYNSQAEIYTTATFWKV